MSTPNRPSFQKPTKSSSASSAAGGGGGGGGPPGGRWNGNFSAGVSPVRGLSPVRGNFHGVTRPDMEMARSHNNPLFASRTSDVGRLNNTPTKACKDCKENRDRQEQWKNPTTPGKTLCTTPGKSSRTTATMRFTTPPKPVVRRKILAENRELLTTGPPPSRLKEEDSNQIAAACTPPVKQVMTESISVSQSRNEDSECLAGEDGLPSLSPQRSQAGDPSKPKSPLVSIEELQKRIQKFLQDEGTSAVADTFVPLSPRQSTESLRRLSEESSLQDVEEAPLQPVLGTYSPRPEFLRARKSPTPAALEGNVSPQREEDSVTQEKTTPTSTYDPKNNFLSPRPQFLRYRPLRRLELLRKSAEGTLADLDLESPATDADSSRMGSEKDEKEEGESQDTSQEVQSLKSSLEESSPRCKVSSYDLFRSAETNCEITQQSTEEPISSLNTPEADASLEVPPPHLDSGDLKQEGQECGDLKLEDQQEQLEEEDMDTSPSVWHYACGLVAVLALIALLVVASGSPSLLPTSLHHNHISQLWKTSKVTEPIRQFLQTTEGLWAVNTHLTDFPPPSPDIIRVSFVHILSLIQSVDLSKVVETGKVLWSSGMRYAARFGQLSKSSYMHFKASLHEEIEFYNLNDQEVNEWDWVPDYDFVVPHDMFDPVEAYENIMVRLESWEVKSSWSSFIQAYSKHRGSKSVIQLIIEQSTSKNLDRSNSSQCSLSSRPEDEVVLKIHVPAPLGTVLADMPIPPSQVIELNVNIAEKNEEKDIVNPQEQNAGGYPASILTVEEDQELEVSNVATELSIPQVDSTASESAVDAIESLHSTTEEENPLSRALKEVALLSQDAEEIQAATTVEDFQVPEPSSSQDLPFSVQEGSQAETSDVEEDSNPEENDTDLHTPLENKKETPRSLIAEKLMRIPNLKTTGAIVFSLLVAACVALLVSRMSNVRSGKRRRASRKASAHRLSKSSRMEAQLKEADKFQLVEESRENDFFVADSSAAEQLSSDHIKQFATPYPVTLGAQDAFLGKFVGKDLTPRKPSTHLTNGDTSQIPDTETSEDSSLGSYSTIVPVVRNEGTPKELWQLTPVRRSSRIRTKMQSSPCNLLHSPYLCNC